MLAVGGDYGAVNVAPQGRSSHWNEGRDQYDWQKQCTAHDNDKCDDEEYERKWWPKGSETH